MIKAGKERDDIILSQYINGNLTRKQLAEYIGVSYCCIDEYITRHKFTKYGTRLYKDKSWLYNQYINLQLSSSEIAKICNVQRSAICSWLRKFEIKTRNGSERFQLFKKSRKLYTEDEIKEIELYRMAVWQVSNINFRNDYWKINPNNHKRGKHYHLDHKYPIIKGFYNNIVPSIIGSTPNLQMLKSVDNLVKYDNETILLEDLLKAYFIFIKGD